MANLPLDALLSNPLRSDIVEISLIGNVAWLKRGHTSPRGSSFRRHVADILRQRRAVWARLENGDISMAQALTALLILHPAYFFPERG